MSVSDCCIQDAKVTSCYPELLTQELCPARRTRTSSRSSWETLTKASCTEKRGREEEEEEDEEQDQEEEGEEEDEASWTAGMEVLR